MCIDLNGKASLIVLIEGNPEDTKFISQVLGMLPTPPRVTTFESAEKAWGFLNGLGTEGQTSLPDLIILDLLLPGMSGTELLIQIKTDTRLRTIPILVLSTIDDVLGVSETYGFHANCFVGKPLDRQDLESLLIQSCNFWLGVARLPRVASAPRPRK